MKEEDKVIFISHRSTDKDIADIFLDFLASTGIPKELVFCSSLPGNDVKRMISREVKEAIQKSVLNIVILSEEYYHSVYCLNEEGIIWFRDTPAIVVAMPEIQSSDMLGFLNDEYKIRRLDSEIDIAAIYDQIIDVLSSSKKSVESLAFEIKKIKQRYEDYISKRVCSKKKQVVSEIDFGRVTTDDEKIVLYYIFSHKMRRINDVDVNQWVTEGELYGVNVMNAFDLLTADGWGTLSTDGSVSVFELGIAQFRTLSNLTFNEVEPLLKSMDRYCRLSKDKFLYMWDEKMFNEYDLLFMAYILDESQFSFGGRWMAEGQVDDIKRWEAKNNLESILSKNYGKCLSKYIENNFVYESSWTSYGNPREHTMHKSLKTLFMNGFPYIDDLKRVKEDITMVMPF